MKFDKLTAEDVLDAYRRACGKELDSLLNALPGAIDKDPSLVSKELAMRIFDGIMRRRNGKEALSRDTKIMGIILERRPDVCKQLGLMRSLVDGIENTGGSHFSPYVAVHRLDMIVRHHPAVADAEVTAHIVRAAVTMTAGGRAIARDLLLFLSDKGSDSRSEILSLCEGYRGRGRIPSREAELLIDAIVAKHPDAARLAVRPRFDVADVVKQLGRVAHD